MGGEVGGDHIGVCLGEVGLGVGVHRPSAHVGQSLGQLLIGDIPVQIDRDVIQPLHRAVHQSIDIVISALSVLHQIQDVLLGGARLGDSIGLLEDRVSGCGDGSQILGLDAGDDSLQMLEVYEFVRVVSHINSSRHFELCLLCLGLEHLVEGGAGRLTIHWSHPLSVPELPASLLVTVNLFTAYSPKTSSKTSSTSWSVATLSEEPPLSVPLSVPPELSGLVSDPLPLPAPVESKISSSTSSTS